MEIEATDLFPTRMWATMLEDADEVNAPMRERLEGLLPEGILHWQSHHDCHTMEVFDDICDRVLTCAKRATKEYGVRKKDYGGLVITGAWVNYTFDHKFSQESHTHPNNFLSAIYYVSTPRGCGVTSFTDPRPGAGVIMPRTISPNTLTAMKTDIKPKAGMIVVFPSYLPHRVLPGTKDGHRITMSFNMNFKNHERLAIPIWD